jgi:hypothetical protein
MMFGDPLSPNSEQREESSIISPNCRASAFLPRLIAAMGEVLLGRQTSAIELF